MTRLEQARARLECLEKMEALLLRLVDELGVDDQTDGPVNAACDLSKGLWRLRKWALDQLVVPALAWIGLATMFSAAMVQAGGSPRWAVAILGIACSIPYGVFIWATLTDRHNGQGHVLTRSEAEGQ